MNGDVSQNVMAQASSKSLFRLALAAVKNKSRRTVLFEGSTGLRRSICGPDPQKVCSILLRKVPIMLRGDVN